MNFEGYFLRNAILVVEDDKWTVTKMIVAFTLPYDDDFTKREKVGTIQASIWLLDDKMATWPRKALIELFTFFKTKSEDNYVQSVTAEYRVTGNRTMEIVVDGHKFLGEYDGYYEPSYAWQLDQPNTEVDLIYEPKY